MVGKTVTFRDIKKKKMSSGFSFKGTLRAFAGFIISSMNPFARKRRTRERLSNEDRERLKLGPTEVWKGLVSHHEDIFVSHVIPKLNETDRWFFARASKESRDLLVRAGVDVTKFRWDKLSSVSTLEYCWNHFPFGKKTREGEKMDELYFLRNAARPKKLELLKWACERCGHVTIKCTCTKCSANNGANAVEMAASYGRWLNANDLSVATSFDQTKKKSFIYAGHVDRKCARCRENGTALNIKKEHELYPGGFLCNKCKVYNAFEDPRGCGVCCNHLYGYKLTLPEMKQMLEGDGSLKSLEKLTFPPNASPLDRDVCGVCWCMLRTKLGDMAKREREAASREKFLKSGNTHEERIAVANKQLARLTKQLEDALSAFRTAVRTSLPSSEVER
jgi:hypothetical protein